VGRSRQVQARYLKAKASDTNYLCIRSALLPGKSLAERETFLVANGRVIMTLNNFNETSINMIKYASSLLLALCLSLATSSGSYSDITHVREASTDADNLPVPADVPGLLFYIQRDPNSNTICYQLNVDERGQLREKDPIHAFWIRYTDGGIRRELNYIQKKFAYGISSKSTGNRNYELRSVAYSKLPLYLRRDNRNEYHVYANIDKRECILSRVFIRIDGGTFWSPNVLYIELKGVDPVTGKTVVQRIRPV
jgi:hypothetical protein